MVVMARRIFASPVPRRSAIDAKVGFRLALAALIEIGARTAYNQSASQALHRDSTQHLSGVLLALFLLAFVSHCILLASS